MNIERARAKRLVSIHEAAHAVAYLIRNQPVRRLSIITTARGMKPCGCRARRKEHMDQGYMATDDGIQVPASVDIKCSFAGAMAERAFIRMEARESGRPISIEEIRSTHACGTADRAIARAAIEKVGFPIRDQIRLELEAAAMVDATFPIIMALADELLERKVMAKHEIESVYQETISEIFK